MQLKNSTTHFGHIGRVLHWTSVALLLFSALFGSELGALPPGADSAEAIARHSSVGLLLFATMLMRFSWRLCNLNPVHSYTISAFQRRAAIAMHWFLYSAVVLQCAIGVAQLLTQGAPIAVGSFELLNITRFADAEMAERWNDVHADIANLIYLAVFMHACAAIYHQVFGVVDKLDARH